jgi:flagellar biosynthesis chaperone FliJ
MRTESQIKRKLNELTAQRQSVLSRLESDSGSAALREQARRLEAQIELLEWVLFEPTGAYHG